MEDIRPALEKIGAEFARLAQNAPPDRDLYRCPLCRDAGYLLDGDRARPCSCRREALLREKKQAAGLTARLQTMTFDSFRLDPYPEYLQEEGRSYRAIATGAWQAGQQLARACAGREQSRGLLLQGEVGCGKTHLAAAAINLTLELGGDAMFLVVPEFLDQLRYSYRRENEGLDESELIARTYKVPLLVLDDLGAHNYSEWVCNKLFTIVNHRYNRGLPCLITSNLDLKQLDDTIGGRTASRIVEMCRIFHILVPKDQDHRLGLPV